MGKINTHKRHIGKRRSKKLRGGASTVGDKKETFESILKTYEALFASSASSAYNIPINECFFF